jgi:hypothetical protein
MYFKPLGCLFTKGHSHGPVLMVPLQSARAALSTLASRWRPVAIKSVKMEAIQGRDKFINWAYDIRLCFVLQFHVSWRVLDSELHSKQLTTSNSLPPCHCTHIKLNIPSNHPSVVY